MLKTINPPPENTNRTPEAAERSTTVQSANWKEHILLEKRLAILNRTERNLVHRITIDQKIMFRRFQMKLHKSKISHAELMGDKTTVMELRALYLRDLNTNCGHHERDCEFFNKLQYRPCVTDGSTSCRAKQVAGSSRRKVQKQHSPTRNQSSGRSKDDTSIASRHQPFIKLPPRPATATGTRVEKEFLVLPGVPGESVEAKINKLVAGIHAKGRSEPKTDTTVGDVPERTENYNSSVPLRHGQLPLSRPKMQDSLRSVGLTRRSQREGKHPATQRRGSMFEDAGKINWVDLRLTSEKTSDHVPRIKEFCASLSKYDNLFQHEISDYYANRMQDSMKNAIKSDPVEVPGTPDSERRKYTGNSRVRSLTMAALNINYEDCYYNCDPQIMDVNCISTADESIISTE